MKLAIRHATSLRWFLATAAALIGAVMMSGCSHRSLAMALHPHESFEGIEQGSKGEVASTVDKTVSASGVKKVILGVEVGSAKVTGSSSDGIKVHAVRKYDGNPNAEAKKLIAETRVDINTKGDTIEVKDYVPEALKRGNKVKNLRLDIELSLPAGLSIETGMGVGGVSLDGRFAAVKVGSGVGDVDLHGESGNLSIGSGVGKVHVKDLRCTGENLSVHCGTGDIDVTLNQAPNNGINANAGVGHIVVAVPSNVKASANLSTGVGNCSSDFPLSSPKKSIGDVSGRMDGPINGGGAPLSIKSGVGDITLKKR